MQGNEADINRDIEGAYINRRYAELQSIFAGNYPNMLSYGALDRYASKLLVIGEYSHAVRMYFIAADKAMKNQSIPELLIHLPDSTSSIRAIMNDIVRDRKMPETVLRICSEMKQETISSIAADVFISHKMYVDATKAYLTVNDYVQIVDFLKKAPLPDMKQSVAVLIDRGIIDSVYILTRELRKGRLLEPGVRDFIREVENLASSSVNQKTSLKEAEARLKAKKEAARDQAAEKPSGSDEQVAKMARRVEESIRTRAQITLSDEEILLACAILKMDKEFQLKTMILMTFNKILADGAPRNNLREEVLTDLYNAFEQCMINDRSNDPLHLLGKTSKRIMELQEQMFGGPKPAAAASAKSLALQGIPEIIQKVESHARLEGILATLRQKGKDLEIAVDDILTIPEYEKRVAAVKENSNEIEILQRALLVSPINDAEFKAVCQVLDQGSGAPAQRNQVISALPAFRLAFIGNQDRFDLFVRNVYDSVIAADTLASTDVPFSVKKSVLLSYRIFNSANCLSFDDLTSLSAKASALFYNAKPADGAVMAAEEIRTINADLTHLKNMLGELAKLKDNLLPLETVKHVATQMGRIFDMREVLQDMNQVPEAQDAKVFHKPGATGAGTVQAKPLPKKI